MPCELTRMSTPPRRSAASAKPRRRSARSARSARTATPPSSSAASSARSERPRTAMLAPAPARARARPRPIPPPPPVTSARRPVRSKKPLPILRRRERRAPRESARSRPAPSGARVCGARAGELDGGRGPEELRLEPAPVPPVDADEVLERPPVLEVRHAAEDEDGCAFAHAEVLGDLGGRCSRLDRASPAVKLQPELALVRLEERAVAHVELEDRRAERVRHVRGRHDEGLAA